MVLLVEQTHIRHVISALVESFRPLKDRLLLLSPFIMTVIHDDSHDAARADRPESRFEALERGVRLSGYTVIAAGQIAQVKDDRGRR